MVTAPAATLINSTVLMEYMSIQMKLSMLWIDIIIEFNDGYAVRFLLFLLRSQAK